MTAAVLLLGTRRSYSEGLRGWRCSRVSGRRWRRTTARRGYAEAVELGCRSGGVVGLRVQRSR